MAEEDDGRISKTAVVRMRFTFSFDVCGDIIVGICGNVQQRLEGRAICKMKGRQSSDV
jgi:hypothetical protein